ncbi:transmembrane protein, putative [Bodo saltans]|uniref:Transmembrane protein, putative n=1 Tax=Bodo saltans TaxID=75058 RepID=A0A0S4IYU0_BODSA|nr:transmembrane protein, putative [Bodo saltans]|eukprot:CUG23385.1 transmembrane protein, putative [Bodo saltans]
MSTLRSVLGIRESDVSAIRSGEQNELMLNMDDILTQCPTTTSGNEQQQQPDTHSAINEEDEKIYLEAHCAEDRIRRHREAVDACAPSGAKLGLLQLLSGLLVLMVIIAAFFGSHPGLWLLLAALLFAPLKVYRVPEDHVGAITEPDEDGGAPTVAPEESSVLVMGKKRRRRQLAVSLSSYIDGTDPHGTVHLVPRVFVMATAGYLLLYIVCASLFQLILSSNDTVSSSYHTVHEKWSCSLTWHNATLLANTSLSYAQAVNGTTNNCTWTWPSYQTFGLWDASEDMASFVYFLVPSAVALVTAGALFALLPPRFYYSYNSPAPIGTLGSLKPLAIRLLQRDEAPPPSARPVARASTIIATCLPVFVAAAILPGIVHVVPVLLASAYALSATLAPPSPRLAKPPVDLLPMTGEGGYKRMCYFHAWVFRPSDDRSTRLRSIILSLLYTSVVMIILAQCVWQNPMFRGWNDLDHRRAGFAAKATSWSLTATDAGTTVSVFSNSMQSAWFRQWGLYNVKTYLDIDANVNAAMTAAAAQNLSPSDRVVDGPGALNSVVATTDSGSVSIAVRVIIQTALYLLAVFWLRRAPASIYRMPNPPSSAGPKLASSLIRENEHRSYLFHSAAARALDKDDTDASSGGMVLKIVEPGDEGEEGTESLDTGVGALIRMILNLVSKKKSNDGGTSPPPTDIAKQQELDDDESAPMFEKLHAALETVSGWMLAVSPWVSVLTLIIAVVALPCIFALAVTVPLLVFLATGPHQVLLTARVSAVGAFLLSTHVAAVITYISSERLDNALIDAYDASSWAWFVMVGTPFAMNLAQYGYLILALGVNIVMLTLSFLRCIDSEVAEDLLEESRLASGANREKLRAVANNVKELLPQMGMEITLENIERVAPEIGTILHPFHRAVLLGTKNDYEMEAVMSEVWRFSHLISARQRVPYADWQKLMVVWSSVDKASTTFTMRMVHEEQSLDPVLRSSCAHSLPFDVVRRKILTRIPSVRWLITEEELLLLLHLLDRALPPSLLVYATHWHKRELFIDDVALMLAVFIDGSMFLRGRERRLTEHLPWSRVAGSQLKRDNNNNNNGASPDRRRTSAGGPVGTNSPDIMPLRSTEMTDADPLNLANDANVTKAHEASVDCNPSLSDEVDRNDAWRLLRVFRAVYNENHLSHSMGTPPDIAHFPPLGSDIGKQQQQRNSVPEQSLQLRPIAEESSIFIDDDEQRSRGPPPPTNGNDTFAYAPSQGRYSFIGSQQLMAAMRQSIGTNPSITRCTLGSEDWAPVLEWIRSCSASAVGGWRLRVIEELFRTKVHNSSSRHNNNRSTSVSMNVSHTTATASDGSGSAKPRAADLPMLHARTRVSARVAAAFTKMLVAFLSILWHTLAMSSFLTSMLVFWTASYRSAYNGTQTAMLVSSVILVLCSGAASSSLRHAVVIMCSCAVLLALYATVTGTIFRYAFASFDGYSTESLRNATYVETHDSILINVGLASVEDTPWELLMYFAAFLILQVQRYVYHIDQRKDSFLSRIRRRFRKGGQAAEGEEYVHNQPFHEGSNTPYPLDLHHHQRTTQHQRGDSMQELSESVRHIRTMSGTIRMEDPLPPMTPVPGEAISYIPTPADERHTYNATVAPIQTAAAREQHHHENTIRGDHTLSSKSKDFAVSWAYVQQSIHWRLLSSSIFFAKLQFYLMVILIAILYIAVVGFDAPSYVSTGLLFAYLLIAILGSIHHRSLESRWFRVLLVCVGFVCAMIVTAFGIIHIPFIRYHIQQSMTRDFTAHDGTNFVGKRCGISVLQGDNVSVSLEFVQANLTNWATPIADACLREIGFMRRGNDIVDNDGSGEPIGDSVIPYFFAVMFCAVEYWILKRFAVSYTASSLVGDGSRVVEEEDTSTWELVQTSPLMAAVHKGATFLVFAMEHNLQKVLWLVNLYAAVEHVTLLTIPYLGFFLFDVSGAIPILYSALHLIVVHCYDLSFLPEYWTAEGLQLIGLPKSTALLNTVSLSLFNTTTNTTGYEVVETSVWRHSASLLAVGPALVLAFNLVAKNSSSMIKVTSSPTSQREPSAVSGDFRAVTSGTTLAGTTAGMRDEESSDDDSWQRGNKNTSGSLLHHFARSAKVLMIYLYSELIRTIGTELLNLALLIAIATNPLRGAQIVFFLTWLVAEQLLGRDATRVNGPFHTSSIILFGFLLTGTIVLALRIPFRGSDPGSAAAMQAVQGRRSLNDRVFISQAFFWPTEFILAYYGSEFERYSYARYAGAQPTTSLFWSYGLVICVMKLISRDRLYHETRPRHQYSLRGRVFDTCVEGVTALQRPILMARTHLIRLFVMLKPRKIRSSAGSPMTNSSTTPVTIQTPTSPSSATLQASSSMRSQGILAFLIGKGDAALSDARVMQWEEDLVKHERHHRRQYPLFERLHTSFAQHGVLLFTCLKIFGVVYFPMYIIFGDANENESVLHLALMAISVRLLMATINYETHWTPQRWIPKILMFYQFIVFVTVICNIPTIADFIETYSQPFRALGMTNRKSKLEENGTVHTDETTMALTAWRVAAIMLCVLQQRFQDSFMFLGALASLQDTNIDGRDVHRDLVAGVLELETKEKEAINERGAKRTALLMELRSSMDCPVALVVKSSDGSSPHQSSSELDEPDELDGTLTMKLKDMRALSNKKSAASKDPLGGKGKPSPVSKALSDDEDATAADKEAQERHSITDKVESLIRSIQSISWQPALPPQHRQAEATSAEEEKAEAARQRDEAAKTVWSRLLAAMLRLIALRMDFVVIALLVANFLQSGCLLDGAPLAGALIIALVWHPWAPRFAVTVGIAMLAFNVIIKTAVRFVAGQTVLQPNAARLLGVFIVQMPADSSLLTLNTQGASTKVRGTSTALADIGLDFGCLAALWLYLRIGEHYGLFVVETDPVADTDHTGEESDSDSKSSDSASDVSWYTDDSDNELRERAIQRRADEIEGLEQDISEYETALGARRAQIAAGETLQPQHDLSVDEELDPATLIELVRAADSHKKLPFAEEAMERLKANHNASGTVDDDDAASGAIATADANNAAATVEEEKSVFTQLRENIERKAGAGTDMYTWYALMEGVCVIYIAFGYHTLAGIDGNFVSSLTDNLLPGWLVLWMLLSVFIIAVDRAVYVYAATSYKKAQALKLALHGFLALFYIIFFVAWFATRATDHSNAAGRGLFVMKLLCVLLSAYQIKMGFPTFRRHDPMTASTSRSLPYTVYRAIPFLYESRMLIDWTFTQTTLTFNQYLRVEDVHHEVYKVYCDKNDGAEKRGTLVPVVKKAGRGCFVFIIVLLIVFFPMLYYSTFNPILTQNLVTGAVLTVETDQYGSLFEATALSSPIVSGENSAALDLLYPSLRPSGFLSSNADVQFLEWNSCSMNRWETTIPLRIAMVEKWSRYGSATADEVAAGTVAAPQLSIKISLDSAGSISDSGTTSGAVQYSFTMTQLQASQLATAVNATVFVNNNISTANNGTIGTSVLYNMIVPFVKNVGAAFSLQTNGYSSDLPSAAAYTCAMSLHAETIESSNNDTLTGDYYWCLNCQPVFSESNSVATEISLGDDAITTGTSVVPDDYSCLQSQRPSLCSSLQYENWASTNAAAKPLSNPPYITVSSQMIPETNSLPINVGIIALYATLILSVANMLRDSMSGNATRAMLEEMHDPTPLAELLSYLYMCRGGGDDVHLADPILEEALFLELVDLLRAPDTLRAATGLRSHTYDVNGTRVPILMKKME